MLNLVLLAALFTSNHAEPSTIQPQHLRCEYLVDPVGVDANPPRLSWRAVATDPKGRGLRQSAYRILVATAPGLLSARKAAPIPKISGTSCLLA